MNESTATINGKEVDTGIRYAGATNDVKNYVYYNCKDKDKDNNNIVYGAEGYDYTNSCEIWRIKGAFDVDNGSGKVEKRIKMV